MSVSINGTGGITFADASTQSTGGYTGFRNRIINGAMAINQYGSVPSGLGYPVDRFNTYGTQAGKISTGQNLNSITPPAGFQTYVGVQSSSAFTPASSDIFGLAQPIEANNISDFNFGTANAAAVTLSFWVRSSLTGTFSGSIINYAATRSYPFTFVINSANNWEQKTITIAGDTGGTWVLSGNGGGCKVLFDFGSGSTYRGVANTWGSGFYNGATGSTNLVSTAGATFYITGVQLEKGSVATPFEFRPYGTELALCERYYQVVYPTTMQTTDGYSNTSVRLSPYAFRVDMRSAPTFTTNASGLTSTYSPTGSQIAVWTGGAAAIVSGAGTWSMINSTVSHASIICTATTTFTGGANGYLIAGFGPSVQFQFNSEL